MSEDPHQLEEEEEGRKERRIIWSPTEDLVLCSAWLNTSKDAIVCNEQKATAFWERIAAYFNASPKLAGYQNRDASKCKQRWHKINVQVSKFVGCYETAEKQKTSGYNEADVLKAAKAIFFQDHEVKFNLEHAWIELRNDQKWCASMPTTISKGEGSSKKRKDQSASSQQS